MSNLDYGNNHLNEDDIETALQKNLKNFNAVIAEEEIKEAEDEWKNVQQLVPGLPVTVRTKNISHEELLHFFRSQDMGPYLVGIKPLKRRKGLVLLCRWMLGPPRMKPQLVPERNLVFAMAQYPFDTGHPLHMQVLQTLYKSLTGHQADCPQFGSHWEEIGFQGCNPATDLRGAGFLALFHLIYFITNPKVSSLAKEIYKLSHHEVQHFPFSVMSINITRITLEALREENLNRLCNEHGCVVPVVSDFYCGTFLMLYRIWRKNKKTIMDSGYVIQDVSRAAKKNPRAVVLSLSEVDNEEQDTDIVQFSDIGDISLSMPVLA